MGTVRQEYAALRQRAGVLDYASHGLVEVRGGDRTAFLHNLLTQDIMSLATGHSAEAALVTSSAKVLALMTVLADEDSHWLLLDRRRADTVLTTLERYHITEDVSLHDRARDYALFAVQGPAAPGVLASVPPATLVITHRLTTAPGYCLAVPIHEAANVRERLKAQGAVMVGAEALNICRIEDGLPRDADDVDETRLLPETGLEGRVASDRKGCYVGQEVIARMQTYGSASRKLLGIVAEGAVVPQPRDLIMAGEEVLGEITSACASPALQRPIALGYVKRPHYGEIGTRVDVITGGARQAAALSALPFRTT